MAKKVVFTPEQIDTLMATVRRAQKDKKRFKNQEALALALDLSQPSLSNMLAGKWNPGLSTARHIANLAGMTLEELIGPVDGGPTERPSSTSLAGNYPNLEACVRFYAGTKSWAPWTVAAARAGFFGEADLQPPAWADRLDALDRHLASLKAKA
jgi:transcriptional regulator with XRE-family HTH domain